MSVVFDDGGVGIYCRKGEVMVTVNTGRALYAWESRLIAVLDEEQGRRADLALDRSEAVCAGRRKKASLLVALTSLEANQAAAHRWPKDHARARAASRPTRRIRGGLCQRHHTVRKLPPLRHGSLRANAESASNGRYHAFPPVCDGYEEKTGRRNLVG
jgi:hypothetical protein